MMSLSELHILKIKTRAKFGVRTFESTLVKLREIKNYEKIFVFKGRTRHEAIIASGFDVFLIKCFVIWELVRLRIQNIFITNTHASFHLWRWENLLKPQRAPKYCDHTCRF